MAGDWIKMRIDLQSHPKIVRILSEHKTDKFRVVGGLHAVWSVFDTHSEDGVLTGYSPEALDHVIGWNGFSASLVAIGWLHNIAGGLVMPEFCEHNGKSGKRRAEDQKRKRESRKDPNPVRNLSANEQDEKLTREEKRREEDKELPPLVPQVEKKKTKRSIPEQFMVTTEMRSWAAESAPAVSVKTETENFCDYWRGAGGTKLDWVATWRTWMRKAQKDSQVGGRGGFKPFNKQAAVEENNERVVQEIIAREAALSGTSQNLFDTGDPIIIEGEFIHAH